ncbi:DNA mismatch repair protein MutS [Erysipelothrix urinaevulpis]|uniref:DNA mismatch repair protein MutS n=1 Tax=Erysipelothrix urinaevulpis TaxID=2683717 RepID=UPI00135C3BA0|nr:DNA mismatch repair protein MutS [Erysipelothrix urinaevulpis]
MNKLTPMMKQFMEIKENTKDALVFFRLGDFYELFFEDAEIASRVLDLVLTARSAGNDVKAPMCGVPHHAAKGYIQKLVANGYKVAIVEQVEDPKDVKGIVKREVIEIVTPGTYFEMDDNETREIASLSLDLIYATIVSCDVMSGEIKALRIMNEPAEIIKNLQQFQVREIIVPDNFDEFLVEEIQDKTKIYVSRFNEKDNSIKHDDQSIEDAYARLIAYLNATQKSSLQHLSEIKVLNDEAYLRMDYTSMMNLELIDHQKNKELSVYNFMDKTNTSMGSRLLKEKLMRPLYNISEIKERHTQIDLLMHDFILSDDLKTDLKETYDIHRIVARITTDKHNPQDFVRLKNTLRVFSSIKMKVNNLEEFKFLTQVDELVHVYDTLENAFLDNAPVTFKDGRTFKEGISPELDELITISNEGKTWLLNYEQQEREKTGIKNLKVGYTRAFGYYIDISKGQVENVKDEYNYIRKQTLTNSERYINEELQEYEVKISEAKERIQKLELDLFKEYTQFVVAHAQEIHEVGNAIAYLDVLMSLTEFSGQPGYVKPEIVNEPVLNIKEGRHPVLESSLKDHQYIASSVEMDPKRRTLILTGPNMGGKSTYMRMLAVNTILAQMGCYIPCDAAKIGIVDQIFTRMGASDDILMGQSTFMVEMLESQTALSRASQQSLILFDEIGRGTSTYDGMALAQSIIEYINETIACRTIFSTHYHELVSLEDMYDEIFNVNVLVHEEDKKVTFLYRVEEGRATKSYGINVAKLAHLPNAVIQRAEENLKMLELNRENKSTSIGSKILTVEVEPKEFQSLKQHLNKIDPNNMTPFEALQTLANLKEILGDNHDKQD